jgi:hypothetical protein
MSGSLLRSHARAGKVGGRCSIVVYPAFAAAPHLLRYDDGTGLRGKNGPEHLARGRILPGLGGQIGYGLETLR